MGINATGDVFFSTQYGGDGTDTFRSICLVNGTTIAAVGITSSEHDLPLSNAYQDDLGGDKDMFVVVFDIEQSFEENSVTGFSFGMLLVGFVAITSFIYQNYLKKFSN